MGEVQGLRLFVAVALPEEVRSILRETVSHLRHSLAADRVRWVRPEGMHLTLKFLGQVEAGRVQGVEQALGEAVHHLISFRLCLADLGTFGGRHGVRVAWVGLDGDLSALEHLAGHVERSLVSLGFPRSQRPFRAHLTLGRVREGVPRSGRERIRQAVNRSVPFSRPFFRVDEIHLMQSRLHPGGARYQRITGFPLRGAIL
ncbi:MAG: RNA 2',3'-cyclic phosphodiesterase [Acidobacteriota bacterium]